MKYSSFVRDITPSTPPITKISGFEQHATRMESEIVIDGHGSFDVHLHPLVLLNISDHFTRLRANAKPAEASNTTGM